jgi:hypothetical protein
VPRAVGSGLNAISPLAAARAAWQASATFEDLAAGEFLMSGALQKLRFSGALTGALLCTASTPALAQAPATPGPRCSAVYHEALDSVRTGRSPVLLNLHKALRTPNPDLPGRWLFAAQVFGKPKPAPKPERVCAEMKDLKGGKQKCVRFEMKQPEAPPPEIVIKGQPSADDLRLLRLTHDFVMAKGALPDVGNNGKYNFLVQRIAQDVRLYVGQSPHPALCAGSGELTSFYSDQLGPVKRRMDDITLAAKQLKEAAARRTREVALTEMRLYDKAIASALTAAETAAKLAASQPVETPAAAPTPPPPLPSKPADAAAVADYLITSTLSLIGEAVRPLLKAEAATEVAAEGPPLKALGKAQAAVLDPTRARDGVPAEVRDAALTALRMIEAHTYGELHVERYLQLDVVLFGALKEVRAAQAKSCTCAD